MNNYTSSRGLLRSGTHGARMGHTVGVQLCPPTTVTVAREVRVGPRSMHEPSERPDGSVPNSASYPLRAVALTACRCW